MPLSFMLQVQMQVQMQVQLQVQLQIRMKLTVLMLMLKLMLLTVVIIRATLRGHSPPGYASICGVGESGRAAAQFCHSAKERRHGVRLLAKVAACWDAITCRQQHEFYSTVAARWER